jgi:hypothetical protein
MGVDSSGIDFLKGNILPDETVQKGKFCRFGTKA